MSGPRDVAQADPGVAREHELAQLQMHLARLERDVENARTDADASVVARMRAGEREERLVARYRAISRYALDFRADVDALASGRRK